MPEAHTAGAPVALLAAKCSDYPNQKAAQEAGDARDADGDGIYCEDLPCPCSSEAGAAEAVTIRAAGTRRAARSRAA
jgi:hypothetical protein